MRLLFSQLVDDQNIVIHKQELRFPVGTDYFTRLGVVRSFHRLQTPSILPAPPVTMQYPKFLFFHMQKLVGFPTCLVWFGMVSLQRQVLLHMSKKKDQFFLLIKCLTTTWNAGTSQRGFNRTRSSRSDWPSFVGKLILANPLWVEHGKLSVACQNHFPFLLAKLSQVFMYPKMVRSSFFVLCIFNR